MSDFIKHECGVAMVRLLKPISYYIEKYGTAAYGINKMYLLMQKQHNRGQDGAGLANIKFDMEPGQRYISRYRSNDSQPIKDIFARINAKFKDVTRPCTSSIVSENVITAQQSPLLNAENNIEQPSAFWRIFRYCISASKKMKNQSLPRVYIKKYFMPLRMRN